MAKETYGAPGGAHSMSIVTTTVEEATAHALEIRARDRAIEGSAAWREDQRVKAAIEKAKRAKEQRRARRPYDFG
ncbi:hypothetical protein [Devosia sp. A16]|uniref:hypothetical protein n=1 Tax=Devosia sp. A16 TaxID=1736675 RepID=UPI0006D809F2|nr:hypothetical protein [Devosia sp. A16]